MRSLLVTAVIALPASASAEMVRLDVSAFSKDLGGEFQLTIVTGDPGIAGAFSDLSPTTFQSFCMESGEGFSPGSIYSFVMNSTTVPGVSGPADPLDARTAYLYTKFRNGTLAALGYDYSAAGRQASAGLLQQAIWFIEEESLGMSNAFVESANAAVAPGGEWHGVGIGDVRILNLFGSDGSNMQDQLTLIPAPGGLGILGLSGCIIGRRRR